MNISLLPFFGLGFSLIWPLFSQPNCPKFGMVVDDVILDDVITVGNMQIRHKYHQMACFGRKIAVLPITSIRGDKLKECLSWF